MKHGIVTIVAPLRSGTDVPGLQRRLRALDSWTFRCGRLVDLHFASLSVIGNYDGGPETARNLPPHLVFEASFDGTREAFIDDLVETTGDALDHIFAQCEGYPAQGTALVQVVKNYLLGHDVGADAAFFAYPGRTVSQIAHEHRLRDQLVLIAWRARQRFAKRSLPPPMQRSLVRLLRKHVAQTPHLQGALTLPERPFLVTYGEQLAQVTLQVIGSLVLVGVVMALMAATGLESSTRTRAAGGVLAAAALVLRLVAVWRPRWRKVAFVLLLAAGVAFIVPEAVSRFLEAVADRIYRPAYYVMVAVVGAIVIVFLWLLVWQLCEWRDPAPEPPSWDARREGILRRLENVRAQNHMVGLNPIKPGFLCFRLITLFLVLCLIHGTKHFGKSGFLSGLSTIHFARWVIIDKGRHLLFLSHYDGDWDAYLGDFVEQASKGLTAVWSNCVGFPRAWLLMFGGARDQRAFKAYARQHQHETLWVYAAHPQLTVNNIEDNTALRELLGRSVDQDGIEALVRRL